MAVAIPPVVAELLDAYNAHDVERVVACYAPDYEGTDVASIRPQIGLGGARRGFELLLRAFPALEIECTDAVVSGNRVVIAWTTRARHQGPVLNIPATGRLVTILGVSIITLRGGKIWRAARMWDVAGMLRNLGLLPDLS